MVRLVKRNSRRYAKRQLTWFRRYDEYDWIEIDELTVDQLVDQITESAEISVKS
jgi:tRNA dimethylallyltransferase